MSEKNKIPEVDIVIDQEAGVIREVKPDKLRSKKGHERRVNTSIYVTLVLMSIIWLAPFVFLVFQSFRSYLTESGGMVNYLLPKQWSLDNYTWLLTDPNSDFLRWYGNTLLIACVCAVVQTVIVLSVSYALSRMRFRGRKLFCSEPRSGKAVKEPLSQKIRQRFSCTRIRQVIGADICQQSANGRCRIPKHLSLKVKSRDPVRRQ